MSNGLDLSEIGKQELPPEIKEKLKGASKEKVLAGISRAAAAGVVPPAALNCMIDSVDEVFSSGNGFDFDEWQTKYMSCIDKRPMQFPEFDQSIAAAIHPALLLPMAAFGAGYMIGVWIAS